MTDSNRSAISVQCFLRHTYSISTLDVTPPKERQKNAKQGMKSHLFGSLHQLCCYIMYLFLLYDDTAPGNCRANDLKTQFPVLLRQGKKFSIFSPHKSKYSPTTVPCIILPMSSSSDVIDLERRAMAGGVSLLVCCGAAKKSQPSADLMFILA